MYNNISYPVIYRKRVIEYREEWHTLEETDIDKYLYREYAYSSRGEKYIGKPVAISTKGQALWLAGLATKLLHHLNTVVQWTVVYLNTGLQGCFYLNCHRKHHSDGQCSFPP